jgi:capsular exopolysaccharide synthesis family protein
MELADYLTILRKRWLSITLCALLGLGSGLGVSLATTRIYSAQAQVFVSVRGAQETTGEMLQGANFTVRAVRTYAQLVTSPRVLTPVIDELGLPTTAVELARRVSASSPLDTVLINVSAQDTSPELASRIANATATSLARVVAELETPAGGVSPVQVSTVRNANVPTTPSSPNLLMNLALGALVGLAFGVGLAVLREVLNTKIRDIKDVQAITPAPILGVIAADEEAMKYPLVVQNSRQTRRAEAFRRLRTNLQFLEFDDDARAIVISSPLPGEGKSTTTINLAITLADAGSKVLIIDADLRRPSVAKYLGIEGSVGLTTVLIGKASLDDVTQPWGNGNLDVITSGKVPPNPSELLGSSRMTQLLDDVTKKYDVVLIDSAPLLPVTDAAVLARLSGGVVMVVSAAGTNRGQVADSISTLDQVGAKMLGIIVTKTPPEASGSYAYHYYEYTSDQPVAAKSNRINVRVVGGVPNRGKHASKSALSTGSSVPVGNAASQTATEQGGQANPNFETRLV